jgi:hypothetical protein
MKRPDFFIVGAPKCGTTALYTYLRQHPQVFMPARKEPHYFGSDLVFLDRPRLTEQGYRELFAGADEKQRVGESSVFYLYSERAAREIAQFAPEAQILVMLRNPIDMLHSFHSQRLFNGTEHIVDFEEALEAEADRRRGLRLPRNVGLAQGLHYRELARFGEQVERYQEVFAPERIRVILYEDFRAHTAKVYREVCAFLGIDPDCEPEFAVVNANKSARSRRVSELLWAAPAPLRRIVRVLLPSASVRETLARSLRRLNTREAPRSPIDPDLRRRLEAEFAPDVERLGRLLGRDLAHWTRR